MYVYKKKDKNLEKPIPLEDGVKLAEIARDKDLKEWRWSCHIKESDYSIEETQINKKVQE